MKNALFNVIKSANPSRNSFDLSHQKLMSGNFGTLYPVFFQETIPSDQFKCRTESLIRLHPLISPVFSRMAAYIHYFYVPYRMVWKNFEEFLTGGDDGTFTAPHPKLTISDTTKNDFRKGQLPDYFGVPPVDPMTTITNVNEISALPFRAFAHIYNEYYRDQNLEDKIAFTTDDVVSPTESTILTQMRTRAYPKDYFTSALTDTQKGGEVLLPNTVEYKKPQKVYNASDDQLINTATDIGTDNLGSLVHGFGGTPSGAYIDAVEGIGISINDLRAATRLQEWLERNARSGSRMAEFLLSHFSVKSDDLRINRPRYEGGGKTNISISEVLSTWQSDTIPQGEMSGHGIGVGAENKFNGYYKEYGCVIGILSLMPEHILMNGIPRQFIKTDKFSYCHPIFANLGEQAIYNSEVYFDPNSHDNINRGSWAYQSRYAEYKSAINTVHGDFRDTLSFWHVGRDFSSLPNFNSDFIRVNTSQLEDKIFAVDDSGATNKFYAMLYHNFNAVRPLPIFGTPRL